MTFLTLCLKRWRMNKLILAIFIIPILTMCSMNTKPIQNGDLFSIRTGNLYFEIDASFGGHISSFKVDDHELLYFSGIPDDYLVGSTLWPSPQSVWLWPPAAELDWEPYEAEISGDTITMISKKDPASNLVFKKTFSVNTEENCIEISYEMINEGEKDYSVAAWAVTRVPSKGSLSFFPAGDSAVTGPLADQTELVNGVVWYQQKKSNPTQEKFFSDGSGGWLAHVNKDNYLFVKTFDDVPEEQQAQEEGEIEIFYKNEEELIELENQSAYVKIPPGGSFEYKVKWYAARLPTSLEVSIGSKDLIEHVKKITNLLSL